MTIDQLNTLAHQIAYAKARGDIESFVTTSDKPTLLGNGRWYDLSTVIHNASARECVSTAIFYLDGRGLLIRHNQEPYLVVVMPEPASGAVVPPTLAEALSA